MLGEKILSVYVCTKHTHTHTHICTMTHIAEAVRLWLLYIQSLSRRVRVCFPSTHRVPAPECSWVSGCCGCAGTVPSVGGLSRMSDWGARPVCSGSRTQLRSLLCGTPTWDSWHSPRRWRQIWEEEADKEKRVQQCGDWRSQIISQKTFTDYYDAITDNLTMY